MAEDEDRGDWVARHRTDYLRSVGIRGHVLDLSDVGGRAFTTHCLIRYRGHVTGATHVTPLIYGNFGGELVIVASKGGSDTHPDWYLGIRSQPTVDVQVATQAFEAQLREPDDEERHEVWAYMTHLYPPYISYQQSTHRRIPLVMLSPGGSIDVFSD